MHLTVDPESVRPLIETVVAEVLAKLSACGLGGQEVRVAYSEASAMLGLNQWQLRDERRRGRIGASLGPRGRVLYTREDIARYLATRRADCPSR